MGVCGCGCGCRLRRRRGAGSRPPVEYADQEAQPGAVKVVKSMDVEVWGPEAEPEEEEAAGEGPRRARRAGRGGGGGREGG